MIVIYSWNGGGLLFGLDRKDYIVLIEITLLN